MKNGLFQCAVAVSTVILLAGCQEEKVPEPTAENCAPAQYEKTLAGLSKEMNRNEFTANCKSFLAARKMTQWEFKKSPEDHY